MAKICFIVGHGKGKAGGYDSGAVSGKYHEFKIAKEIAKYAQQYYNENYKETADLMNYKGDLYLQERINRLKDDTYDFIAEIHLNAGGGTGTECYYHHGSKKGQKYADKICDYIAEDLDVKQRPNGTDKDGGDKVKVTASGTDYFGIIRSTKPTAVLIETVFIDTKADLNKVKTAAGQKKCGEAIAKAVAEVRGVKKKTTAKKETIAKKETATKTEDFLPDRGYFKKGDVSENVGEIAAFMRKMFPSYTSEKALGNTYGDNLIKAVKEFQERTGLEADGYFGKLTLAKLEEYGFKK